MLTLGDVESFLYEHFENVQRKGNNTFNAKCVLCGDSKFSNSKKRFNITYTDDNCKYHCFNCGEKGDFYGLYAQLNNVDSKEAWKNFHCFNTDTLKKSIRKIYKPTTKIKEPKTKNFNYILNDCYSVNDTPKGYIDSKYINTLKQFIKDRDINIPVYICYNGKFKDRIIIPVYKGKDIIYFQGRSIFKNSSTKYLNPSTEKSHIIFNEDNLNKNKTVYVTEGILDAQTIEENGTCCLGKEITDQWLRLFLKKYKKVCICLDNDEAGKQSLIKILNESKYAKKLSYFLMSNEYNHIKDINMLKNKYKNVYVIDFINKYSYSYWDIKKEIDNEINRNRQRCNNSKWKKSG